LSETEGQKTFGKYQILERIAVGGMAEIYKARLEGLGGFHRTFAIKKILPQYCSNNEFVEMLVEEAKIAGLLSHANIVQIVDLGQVEGSYYIAMEYVDGPDLERILQRAKSKSSTLPIPHAVFVTLEILKALEYAHNRQVMRGGRPVPLDIVHRDLCPANILVSAKGEIKLTDFGIAKASVRSLDTVSGVVKGRFDYLSPEQARGEEASQRSDIFSVGVILYEMLTGRHPFTQTSQGKTIEAIKKASYAPAVVFNADVPPAIDRLLAQILTSDPAERFGSATALKDSLDRFFHEAGFIFSHSTLAAYMNGLFPELNEDNPATEEEEDEEDKVTRLLHRNQPIPDMDLVRLDTEEHQTAERPTPGHLPGSDTTQRHAARKPLTSLETSLSGVFGPIDHENTIVDKKPEEKQDWGELETVIRPVMEAPSDAPTRAGAENTRVQGGPVIRRRSAPTDFDGGDTKRKTNPRVRRAQVWSLVIGVVIVIVVFLAGLMIGSQAARVMDTQSNAVRVHADPEVRFNIPDSSTLKIDGKKVSGTRPLQPRITPDIVHEIRITEEGHYPIETTIKLKHDELRIVTFERFQQHEKKAATNGSAR
jgi:serine/threonine protein kinase